MELIYDVVVTNVSSGCLVRQVNRVLEREIPDWEQLIFSVSRIEAVLGVEIYLTQARAQFTTARTYSGSGHGKYLGVADQD